MIESLVSVVGQRGVDAAAFLRQHFRKINAVENGQYKQRQQRIWQLVFQRIFHHLSVLSNLCAAAFFQNAGGEPFDISRF